jgi:hypothetical protein
MGSTRSRARWVSTSGVYFVTAFSGLLAPYWDPGATGLLVDLTSYTTQAHIVRATLEANAFQTRAVIDGIKLDSKSELAHLKVDGGMTNGDVAMEVLADNHFRAFSVSSPSLTQALHQGSAHTLSKPEPGRAELKPRVSSRAGPCTSLRVGSSHNYVDQCGCLTAVVDPGTIIEICHSTPCWIFNVWMLLVVLGKKWTSFSKSIGLGLISLRQDTLRHLNTLLWLFLMYMKTHTFSTSTSSHPLIINSNLSTVSRLGIVSTLH